MLDIEYPIILAGMGGMGGPVSGPELAAAVSNAGGLGVLGCAFLQPQQIRDLIRQTRSLTDKPFGVDKGIRECYVVQHHDLVFSY